MSQFFDRILYGGDYNPEQWPRDVWEEDVRLFDKASINSVTLNVFSWARLQPAEEIYDFTELDAIIERMACAGLQIVLATATAAMPAWLYKRYPEVARVDYDGRRRRFGQRHNACPNSLVYQKYAGRLAQRLAERYGAHPNVICWHINNEYGGVCYCEACEKAFRVWLRERYQTIEALNRAWNMAFWGHTVYDWDEIVLPNALSEMREDGGACFAGIALDYNRFNSDSMLNNFKMERDAIRALDPKTPVTTNMMGTYKQLDYFKWAKELDVVSWDSYPSYNTPWSKVALCHDLMRGLKSQPFMLMEQTPSQQNWQPYNSLKRPGQMRAQSYQTLAHGADTIQFFQMRRSAGACEKFHGAVIEHAGSEEARVFREVAALGAELRALGIGLLGADTPSSVGLIFDWDNYWALEYSSGPSKDLHYIDQIHQYYEYFYNRNIPVDIIPVDADFSQYSLVVAPVLYMVKAGMQQALESFVSSGGVLVTGFMSGLVNESDNVHLGGYPGPLRALCGIWIEEIDALGPDQSNALRLADDSEYPCTLLCDIIRLETAQAMAVYTRDFYAEVPAVTVNRFGDGAVYYVGTHTTAEGLAAVLEQVIARAGVVPLLEERTGLEIVRRVGRDKVFTFVMNFHDETLPLPQELGGQWDELSGRTAEAGMPLAKFDVLLLTTPLG